MPSTTVFTKTGAEAGTIELPDALFAAPVNVALLHQAVVAQLAARRAGTHDTRTRGEVRSTLPIAARQAPRNNADVTGVSAVGASSATPAVSGGTSTNQMPRSRPNRQTIAAARRQPSTAVRTLVARS